MFSLFFIHFYVQVSPAYDVASKYFSANGLQGKNLLVLLVLGLIAVVFIIFLVSVYFKEKNRHKH